MVFIANSKIIKNSKPYLYTSTKEIPHNKVGLLLGTSKYVKNNFINLYFQYRIDAAVSLFEAKKIDIILVSGDNGTIYYNEPREIKNELIKRGIPAHKIYLDYAGFRTLDSVVRAKEVFGQKRFTIISQEFHNQRAVFLASRFSIKAIGFNAQSVSNRYGWKTVLREYLAKTKVFIDLITKKKPKFLGEKIALLDLDKTFVMGKFNYRKHANFKVVPTHLSTKKIYIQKETLQQFVAMAKAAQKADISLKILSGTRSFWEQKAIWERKWKRYEELTPLDRAKKILEYSSMPSTSRHHWGTDIDINNLNNEYFDHGKGKKEYEWLVQNAHKFGFYQVYTAENGRTGYSEEKWHWSYLPLAHDYLTFFNQHISNQNISGFEGAELAKTLDMRKNYVNGVAQNILEYQGILKK
jgi:vancomycin permeability regulator SanA